MSARILVCPTIMETFAVHMGCTVKTAHPNALSIAKNVLQTLRAPIAKQASLDPHVRSCVLLVVETKTVDSKMVNV